MTDTRVILALLDESTSRLIDAVSKLGDDDLRRDSLLPGWSRGHVVSHVARNADALVNLLTWARTGVETSAYSSQEARAADIDAGARRSVADQVRDLTESAATLRNAFAELPDTAWPAPVRVLDGAEFPARQLPARRLTEVELHHTDLGIGYRAPQWPSLFSTLDLTEPMRSWREERRSW